jgi:multidrug transporter EmrE-like cation transporter
VALALLLVNLLLIAGQVGFGKKAALYMNHVPGFDVATNPWYLITIACLLLQALLWPLILKRTPLGFAYAFGALQYPVTLLISRTAFGETVTPLNVVGSGLIVAGVFVWARTGVKTP